MASGFSPPSDKRSRSTRGSDSSNLGANTHDLVPAVSVARTRTQSRPKAQNQAQQESDRTSTPSPQPGVSLSPQRATILAGAAIQRAHQASQMASSAASSALQGHQAAVFAQARERQTEVQAHQVVDQVRNEARAFGHQVMTETQAEAIRLKQELERQAQSATIAVNEAEVRSQKTEEHARNEARELHVQLGGTRYALSASHDEADMLRRQNQQLQVERNALLARLERVDTSLAERIPVPSQKDLPRQAAPQGTTGLCPSRPITQAIMLRSRC